MTEFGVPNKLVRLVKMTLTNTVCKVKVQGQLSKAFKVNSGLRQGDVISTILFNLCLEKVIRKIEINPGGTILNRSLDYMAYADDLNIVSRNTRYLAEAFQQIDSEGRKMGIEVNVDKTKFMVSCRDQRIRDENLTIGDKVFKKVRDFKYLGSTITEDNNTSTEIKVRIAAGNRSYYSCLSMMKSRMLSRKSKVRIYKTLIKPVVMYGSETWTMSKKDQSALLVWERKILRKIYGPVNDHDTWRIRTNSELQELYQDASIVADIKGRRLRWAGHVERMEDSRKCKKVYRGKPEGRRKVGRPRKRWLDDVEEDLKSIGVRGWRRKARDRSEWRKVVREAKVLHEL